MSSEPDHLGRDCRAASAATTDVAADPLTVANAAPAAEDERAGAEAARHECVLVEFEGSPDSAPSPRRRRRRDRTFLPGLVVSTLMHAAAFGGVYWRAVVHGRAPSVAVRSGAGAEVGATAPAESAARWHAASGRALPGGEAAVLPINDTRPPPSPEVSEPDAAEVASFMASAFGHGPMALVLDEPAMPVLGLAPDAGTPVPPGPRRLSQNIGAGETDGSQPAAGDGETRAELPPRNPVRGPSGGDSDRASGLPGPAGPVGDGTAAGPPAPAADNPRPRYPRQALRRGWEGTVVLWVDVQPDGTAGDVGIVTSSGHDCLDAAALDAVRRWRFRPAVDERAVPYACTVKLPITFTLKG